VQIFLGKIIGGSGGGYNKKKVSEKFYLCGRLQNALT